MTEMGHFRQINPIPTLSACPLRSDRGPNKQIGSSELEKAIGPEVLATLSQQTGLSREEILSRLSKNLPEAVDKYTPDGRIPT